MFKVGDYKSLVVLTQKILDFEWEEPETKVMKKVREDYILLLRKYLPEKEEVFIFEHSLQKSLLYKNSGSFIKGQTVLLSSQILLHSTK